MPIYEYECTKCGTFEVEQKISESPLTECPTCSKEGAASQVQRVISASAFHLKGGGWYKSDYATGSSAAKKTEASEAACGTEKKEDKGALKTAPCGGGCKCH